MISLLYFSSWSTGSQSWLHRVGERLHKNRKWAQKQLVFFPDTPLYLHRSEKVQPNTIPMSSLIRTKQAMLIRCLVHDRQCSVMTWTAVAFLTAPGHLISLTTLSFLSFPVRSLHIHMYRFLKRLLQSQWKGFQGIAWVSGQMKPSQ